MASRRARYFFLVLAFATLWAPLGQQEFLVNHWMRVGAFLAPFLMMTAAATRAPGAGPALADMRYAAALMLGTSILHQFEEHWVDLTGAFYAFYDYVNDLVFEALGRGAGRVDALSIEAIFVINTALVWLVGALAIVSSPDHRFPALAMAAIMVVNGATHVAAAIATASYNPGLATSVVVFLPFGVLIFRAARRRWRAPRREIAASLVWAVLAHGVMIGGMLASRWAGLFSESVYFALLVIWSLTPLALYRRRARR